MRILERRKRMEQHVCDRCGAVIDLRGSDMSMHTEYLYDKDCVPHRSRYELCDRCLKHLDLINENFIAYDEDNDIWRYDVPHEGQEVIVSVCDDHGDTPYYYTTSAWLCGNVWISDNEVLIGEVICWKLFPKPVKRSEK